MAMSSRLFAEELAHYGPDHRLTAPPSLAASRAYCRNLARRHYENFSVASMLLPRRLRPHFHAIYAYCRWADDLADEIGDPVRSLQLLDWWEDQLDACYAGRAAHPVFVALDATISQFSIPAEPFRDLLIAFRQDQRVTRYETRDDVLRYCRNSANPVGRLVLYLGRCHDQPRTALADNICTGLQMANFCQDVARDWRRGRIYLPLEDCRRHGYREPDFAAACVDERFRRMLAAEVARAEDHLRAGLPLVGQVPRFLGGDVWLFAQGGLAILDQIRRVNYDVWSRRPVVSRVTKLRLLAGCVRRNWRG
jgi:squalene synthase HpnC